MKKMIGTASCAAGVLLAGFGIAMKVKEGTSVVIGGADGPTAVFIAGKWNSDVINYFIFAGIILAAAALIVCMKRKQ